MAFVPGFEYDVYVSYARVAEFPGHERWVSDFVTSLYDELTSGSEGQEFRMFFDKRHLRFYDVDSISEFLKEKVSKSAVLVAVNVPNYLMSTVAQEEISAFLARPNFATHIVLIESSPQIGPYPDALRRLSRFKFWKDLEHRIEPGQSEWTIAIQEVARVIKALLHQLRGPGGIEPEKEVIGFSQVHPDQILPKEPTATGKVFICYRRDDSAGHAGRVNDRLARELGHETLFMDIDNIDLGVDFVEVLQDEVGKCDVLLAIIGPNWLNARDDDGNRCLDEPNDFVRVEIATALHRNIPVIPILLDGTKIPKSVQLPDNLKKLALRNALDVRHNSFHSDMDKLIQSLKKQLRLSPGA
jgi:hypothetical protein